MNRKSGIIVSLFLLAQVLVAVKVEWIEKKSFTDFQKGSMQNVSIDNRGRVLLGPKVNRIAGPGEEFYLSLEVAGNGDIYLGTGHNAAVYHATKGGKFEQVFKGEQLDVYALLISSAGDLYVGTSPNGRVFKVDKDKKSTPVFDPEEKFIWDLKEDKQGKIFCAVGSSGGVYSIAKDGQIENVLTAEDAHIVALYVTRDNTILAGSGDRGILYAISNRKTRVIFDSPLEEIKGICEDEDGNIYFAAVKSVVSSRSVKEVEIDSLLQKPDAEKEAAPVREKSILYCLSSDGSVERIWASADESIYSVAYDRKTRAVLLGTGNSGRLYRVKRDGTFAMIFEDDSAQIFAIAENDGGFLLIANNTPVITRIEGDLNSSGTYFADVFDAKISATFGRITWYADLPAQTAVSFAVRLGNSDNPDKSWTAWSAPFTNPDTAQVNLSGYRFLQVKAMLNTANPLESPALINYKVYYLENNLRPQLGDIQIEKPVKKKEADGEAPLAAVDSKKHLAVSWEADDPNGDQLNFDLYVKKLAARDWLVLRKNVAEKKFDLETELFEDGKYLLKIEADDGLNNSPALAKNSSLVSYPFIIDSTAPQLLDWLVSGNVVTFRVADNASAVNQVLYSLDGKMWIPLFPDDRVADSLSEKYSLAPANLHGGKLVFIKVSDEFDNYKVFQKEL